MGCFSWMFADTNNEKALCIGHPGYLVRPDGSFFLERCYDGYGRFGSQDVFDLVADWNREFLSRNPDYIVPQHGTTVQADGSYKEAECKPVSSFEWYPAYSDLSLNRQEVVKRSGISEYRIIGIELACYNDQNEKLPFPIKVCESPCGYYSLPASKDDPNQGIDYEKEKTYYVTFAIDARYVAEVQAITLEEAKRKAETEFEAADIGDINIIGSECIIVEDENGEFLEERS